MKDSVTSNWAGRADLGEHAYRPPEAGSAVRHGSPEGTESLLDVGGPEQFLEFVKRCFAQKRKSVWNNLTGAYARSRLEKVLSTAGLSPTIRAEQLTLEQLALLYRGLAEPVSSIHSHA